MFASTDETPNPMSFCEPTGDRVRYLIEPATEEVSDGFTYLASIRYGDIWDIRHEIRRRMRSNNPKYNCAICDTPVSLCQSARRKRWYFKHLRDEDRCPIKTAGKFDQKRIAALVYQGIQEGEPHKRLKRLIAESISADAEFTPPEIEQVVKSRWQERKWRKPDVQTSRAGRRFAFEGQLSTTFLDVILDRKEFYQQQEETYLVWILRAFDPASLRATEEDIAFPNNRNAIVVDDETLLETRRRKTFMVRCWYLFPEIVGAEIRTSWRCEMVPFRALTLDRNGQRAFYYDFEREFLGLKAEIERRRLAEIAKVEEQRLLAIAKFKALGDDQARREKEAAAARREQAITELRTKFEAWFVGKWLGEISYADAEQIWRTLAQSLAEFGFALPLQSPNIKTGRFLSGIYSAKRGEVVGCGYQNLLIAGHQLYDQYPDLIFYYCAALKFYERTSDVDNLDSKGIWKPKKVAVFQQSLKGQKYAPDNAMQPYLEALFPEILAEVQSLLDIRREDAKLKLAMGQK